MLETIFYLYPVERTQIIIDLLCSAYLQLALTILYIAGGVFAAGWIGKQPTWLDIVTPFYIVLVMLFLDI